MDHSPATPERAVPDPHDGFASNPVVSSAVRALRTFGGEITRAEAVRLLSMWAHVGELTAREKAAVLARFPLGDVTQTGYDLATGGGPYDNTCRDCGRPANGGYALRGFDLVPVCVDHATDSDQPQGTEPGA